MTGAQAHEILSRACAAEVGRFYGDSAGLAVGAGLIYDAVRCPMFDSDDRLFLTYESPAYVLTHECDVDAENDRGFSDHVLICPLIPIRQLPDLHQEEIGDDEAFGRFLSNVAARHVQRVLYLPPGPGALEYGALAYLNNITNTHVAVFDGLQPLAAVSAYGLREVDLAMDRHLRRPKADRLTFEPPPDFGRA